ncbi:hypothetical protein HYW76_05825 [Candidatus Pacearchaeota archaeon]|nr:hypothetical protein [Candidatus Pacearchaeota archaeon]
MDDGKKKIITLKAAIYTLGESIGFKEAETYWKILSKEKLIGLNKSKKYRIFQQLFKQGFLFKIRKEGMFEYLPVPPTFLQEYGLENSLLTFYEKEYTKNYPNLFSEDKIFLETSEKSSMLIDNLLLFLMRQFMKKGAKLLIGGPTIFLLLSRLASQKMDKIEFIGIEEFFKKEGLLNTSVILRPKPLIADRRFCVVDNRLLISFFKTVDNIYIGYITSNPEKIQEKLEEFNFIRGF